jgi:hypothetical protein
MTDLLSVLTLELFHNLFRMTTRNMEFLNKNLKPEGHIPKSAFGICPNFFLNLRNGD